MAGIQSNNHQINLHRMKLNCEGAISIAEGKILDNFAIVRRNRDCQLRFAVELGRDQLSARAFAGLLGFRIIRMKGQNLNSMSPDRNAPGMRATVLCLFDGLDGHRSKRVSLWYKSDLSVAHRLVIQCNGTSDNCASQSIAEVAAEQ